MLIDQGDQVAKKFEIVEDKEWEKEVWSPPLIIIRSGVRSALRTTTNQHLASPSGEGTTLPFPIPYPQQSQISLPLDPLDKSSGKEI